MPQIIVVDERGAVDHRRVDDLALARALGGEHRRDHPEGEEQSAAAEVADQVERRERAVARPPERLERAGEGDVVDVVPGSRRHRACLAPTGHPAVDEPGIARPAGLGPDAEPLGDARAEAFDERVGPLDEGEHECDAVGVLQVDADRALAPLEQVPVGAGRQGAGHVGRSLDPQHVRAEVGEHHRAERAGADPGELDDLDPLERPAHRAAPTASAAVV